MHIDSAEKNHNYRYTSCPILVMDDAPSTQMLGISQGNRLKAMYCPNVLTRYQSQPTRYASSLFTIVVQVHTHCITFYLQIYSWHKAAYFLSVSSKANSIWWSTSLVPGSGSARIILKYPTKCLHCILQPYRSVYKCASTNDISNFLCCCSHQLSSNGSHASNLLIGLLFFDDSFPN